MAIDIRVVGNANLGQVQRELGKLAMTANATTQAFRDQTNTLKREGSRNDIIANYRNWEVAQNALRDNTIALTKANGDFSVSSMKVGSQTDSMVERIQKQQLTFRQMRKEMDLVKQTYKDQMRIQASYARTWGKTAAGSTHVDLVTPNFDVQGRGWDNIRTKAGFYNEVLKSVSTQTVNWGKNTQWAGRQLMAGITYPLVMAGGLMAKTAYDVDKALTQIVKVYGSSGDAVQHTGEQIKAAAMDTARSMTQYGQSINDTLEIQSQLASTGVTGHELQQQTAAVTRARVLGELDIQDAMKATITMQEVYGFKAEELAEKFNFINQMENETSLTAQDFVEGMPKIAGIMKTLGADFEDTGVLMAAMKTAGIDAKEGGNAIKSMVFKDIAPSAKAAKLFIDQTGTSLQSIVDNTKGDPVETLQAIGAAMKDLSETEQVSIVKEVFGIHQGSKALGMIQALTKQTGQMGKAFEIANSDSSEWAATARRELEELKKADWLKVKQSIENTKIALVDFGKVILSEAAPVLETIGKVLGGIGSWFAETDSSIKKFATYGLVFGALAGPLIMLTGLFANLMGQAMKASTALLNFAGGNGLVTSKQRAATLAAQQQTTAVENLTKAYEKQMYMEREMLRSTFIKQDPRAAAALGPAMKNPSSWAAAAQAATMGVPNLPVGNAKDDGRKTWSLVAADSSKIADSSEKTKRSWKSIATSTGALAVGASTIGMMSTSSGTLVNNLSTAVFFASLIGPNVLSGLQKSGVMAYISKMGASLRMQGAMMSGMIQGSVPGMAGVGSKVSKGAGAAKGAIMSLGASIAGMAGPIGIAAIAAGGLFYMYKKRASEAKAQQDALNNSADTFGKIVGANLRKQGAAAKTKSPEKRQGSDYIEMAEKAISQDEDLKKAIEKMEESEKSTQAALEYAITQVGNQMRSRGATAEEATEGARIAAVAINKELAASIKWRIRTDMFIDVKDVRIENIDRVRRQIVDAQKSLQDANDGFADLGSKGITIRDRGRGGSGHLGKYATFSDDILNNLKEDVKASWQEIGNAEGKARQDYFNKATFDAHAGMQEFYDSLSRDQQAILAKQGVFDGKTLQKWMDRSGGQDGLIKHMKTNGQALTEAHEESLSVGTESIRQTTMYYLMEVKKMTQEEANKAWANGVRIDSLVDVVGVDKVASSNEALAGTYKVYKKEVEDARKAGKAMSHQEQLDLLNKYRLQEGLKETTTLQDGMNRKVTDTIGKTDKYNKKMEGTAAAHDKAAKSGKKLYDILSNPLPASGVANPIVDGSNEDSVNTAVEKYKSVWQGVADEMYEEAQKIAEDRHQAALDAIEKESEAFDTRQERERERKESEFEKRSEALDAAFDRKEEKFESRWDKSMEKFDSTWDRTMENFDTKWENKSDKFSEKWDTIMDNFEKKSERAKKAVEAQYDARIKKVEEEIKKEQEAEEIRQRIFEREKARIQHLADMANRTIDINMSINSGDLDEAARLSNDAQAAVETYEIDDAGQISKTGSEKRIERLEGTKDNLGKQKDAAIERIEKRLEAERKALEESRKIAEKAFENAQKRERKILEAQQARERKSLESQRAAERKSLESQRAAATKRLEAERQSFARSQKAAKEANDKLLSRKRRSEVRKYEAAKKAMDDELFALRGAVPRNEKEMKAHMDRIEKAYSKYGVALKSEGSGWGKSIRSSLVRHTDKAKNEMQNDINWEKMSTAIANRMTKGAFKMSFGKFMKWVGGGADFDELQKTLKNASKSKSKSSGLSVREKRASGLTGQVRGGKVYHKGGVIDGSRGSGRAGFSGSGLSQSEVNITALKGEGVLSRKAVRLIGGKSSVDALNSGNKAILDDQIHQRGDGPGAMSMFAAVPGILASSMVGGMIQSTIANLGARKRMEEFGELGNWLAGGLSAGTFAGIGLDSSQMKNASTIASVGKSLGASTRDIIIALMTAMQESTLRNLKHGDRDSVGLFQQRAPWGSFADRTNPRESARMFFQGGQGGQPGLFSKTGRNEWSLGQAAQAVQVSAFPKAYTKWEAMARAIVDSIKWSGSSASLPAGKGGKAYAGMGYEKMWQIVSRRFPSRRRPSPNQLNQGGHSSNSYHYKGRAVDFGSANDPGVPLSRLFNFLYENYGRQSKELIYGPMAHKNIKNGRHLNYGPQTNASHMGHIHWAMKNGGMVEGVGRGDKTPILGEPGEFMIKRASVDKIGRVGPDLLRMLNSDRFVNMPERALTKVSSPVGSVDSNSYNEYNINVDATGNANPEDIGRAVEDAITNIERRKGFNRRIGN